MLCFLASGCFPWQNKLIDFPRDKSCGCTPRTRDVGGGSGQGRDTRAADAAHKEVKPIFAAPHPGTLLSVRSTPTSGLELTDVSEKRRTPDSPPPRPPCQEKSRSVLYITSLNSNLAHRAHLAHHDFKTKRNAYPLTIPVDTLWHARAWHTNNSLGSPRCMCQCWSVPCPTHNSAVSPGATIQ